MIKTKIKGLNEVITALKEFDVPKEDIKSTLIEEGNYMAEIIKGNIPSSSGKLKGAFQVFARDKYPTSVMLGYNNKVFRDGTTIAGLASIIEFGAAAKPIKKGKTNKKGERYIQIGADGKFYTIKSTPQRPAFAPVRRGFDSSEKQVQNSLGKKLNELVKKEAKKKNLKTK